MLSLSALYSQERLVLKDVKYIGDQYTQTMNKSFINRALVFLDKENKIVIINRKIGFDINQSYVLNTGIMWNCSFTQDQTYTISLSKICPEDFFKYEHSYYAANTQVDSVDCSRFYDYQRNTEFSLHYLYYLGLYVDIDFVLYRVDSISPEEGCLDPSWLWR